MTAADVQLVIQHALEVTGARPRQKPGTAPQIVSDNGVQFTSKDFKQLIRQFELEHIRIRTYHPESNGVLERFHRSTREEIAEEDLENLARAREIITRWSSTITTNGYTLGSATCSLRNTTTAPSPTSFAMSAASLGVHLYGAIVLDLLDLFRDRWEDIDDLVTAAHECQASVAQR